MCVRMEEWSISVEGRPSGAGDYWFDEGVVEALSEALESYYPAVSGGGSLEARISIEAQSVEEAVSQAMDLYRKAAKEALGGEELETVAVDIMTVERLEEEMFEPDEREVLLGVAEAADFLGVSKTRVGTLRTRSFFPKPSHELASGPVWRLIDLKGFEKGWDRRPGPKKIASLGEARKAVGKSIGDLAAAIHLPKDVLIKLERGRISAEGLPSRLIERLGEALGRSVDQVRALVASGGGMRMVFYKAEGAPDIEDGPKESFEEALQESPYLDEDYRKDWLPEDSGA